MAKQNIYDNDSFFENFKNLRNNKINFNDCIETPILLAMIPEVDGKRVLDIGCGMGQHAKQYSDMGAESVLGIDISEKMLEYCFMAETEDVLQKRELLGGRDDAKTIAQQLAEGRAQAARENAARPTPAKGKEARDDR